MQIYTCLFGDNMRLYREEKTEKEGEVLWERNRLRNVG